MTRPVGNPWHHGQIAVLRELHRAGSASRAELAQATGLTPQSLTRIAQELIAADFIRERERRRTGGMGQPAIELGLVAARIFSVGLVLEHDQLTCVLSDVTAGPLLRKVVRGNFLSARRTLEVCQELVALALASLPDQAVNLGIGVSQSGFFFDVKNQRIVSRGDTEGWQAAHLSARLGESFGLPVWIENDGRAAAAGAMMHGLGVGHDDFFVVLLTRGVGGGAVVGRTLVRGHAGNAGEVAMLMPADPRAIRPTTDSFEQHWRSNMGRRRPTSKAVQDALQAEEPWLRAWLDESARLLSLGLTAICALLDPELIILAGRLPAALREALKARIRTPVASIAGIAAPPARILVDPDNECLEIGASAIPIAKVLGLHRL